ncbi:MAG TPA: amino acid permease, partial [Candidatus Thermoplasmatota archaeon]|nr:amino acid permease [Candidatus Thermoplasmatota archaeon]
DAGFQRSLGATDLTGIGIAAIIGSGIFFLLGLEARSTGPAVIVSLLLAGAAACLAALSYAEFASILPGNGSAYEYAYAAFGRMPAFLMGWIFVNSYAIGNAVVVIGWSDFFASALASVGMPLPDALLASPGDGGIVNLPAILVTALVTLLVLQGIKESTRVNNALVALKLLIVVFIIGFGAFFVQPSNWTPFSPAGFSGVAASTAVLFFAYLGFDTVAAAGAEAREPRKHLPVAILVSIGVCTLLYVIMAAVVSGMTAPADLAGRAPVAAAFGTEGHGWAAGVITLGALIALATVTYAFHLAMARIFQAMGRDGFIPGAFAKMSPRTRTPAFSAIVVGLITAIAGGFLPLDKVVDMAVEASIAIYALVSIGVLVLRRVQPAARPAFRTPAIIHVIAVVALVSVVAFGLGAFTHLAFLAWLGLGLAVYGFYASRRSHDIGGARS